MLPAPSFLWNRRGNIIRAQFLMQWAGPCGWDGSRWVCLGPKGTWDHVVSKDKMASHCPQPTRPSLCMHVSYHVHMNTWHASCTSCMQ